MYLKFVRQHQPYGDVQRGTLYSVHFQPNEKGDYNEQLTIISDAYEIPRNETFPQPLIYQVEVVRLNGYLWLTYGAQKRKAALHLINQPTRNAFLFALRQTLTMHVDVRLEICDA